MADLDPTELTIDELEAELDDVDDPEALEEIREAEADGEDRTGAKEAIDQRLEAVSNDGDEHGENEESDSDSDGGNDNETSSEDTDAGIIEVRNSVRNAASDLIGRPLDGIVEIERTDDGWRVVVEIIERSSVPDTQDIIGRYALELDAGGTITGYRRLERYRRGDTRQDEQTEPPSMSR